MKRILYIIPMLVVLLATSCDDLLTQKSPDQLTSDTFWRDKSDAEAAMASAYSMIENGCGSWDFMEVKYPVEAYREDINILGTDAANYGNWTELRDFTYGNGNSQFSLYWNYAYIGINRTNQIIEKVPTIPATKLTESDREQLMAEAHFLRGYYHMKLLLNWEKIILRDKYITSQADIEKPLATREAAWDFIISEFQAATKLADTRDAVSQGRATKGAAYSYLGFAYLTRAWEKSKKAEYFEKAIQAFDEVKGYSLVKDYISMFDGTNRNSPESIFERQFTSNTANGASYRPYLHKWIGVSELGGYDEIAPSPMLVNEFKKEGKIATTGGYDSRMYATIFFQDPYFNDPANPRVYGDIYDNWFCQYDEDWNPIPGTAYNRPAYRKFLPRTLADLNKSRVALNVPLMRYSNVLLMKAEALNELGKPELAIPLINQVRERADMPAMQGTSKEQVLAQIKHERTIEFALENFRWYDLRRWGELQTAMTAAGRTNFNPSKNSFYPIPQTELNSNNAISK
jgi:hypothetical protein